MTDSVDLSTRYLGLELKSPLVASSSPLSETLEGMKRLEDAGAAAIVMFSLFEEHLHDGSRSSAGDAPGALSEAPTTGPDEYLELLHAASESCDIPVIASLNGRSPHSWSDLARKMAQAGAAADVDHLAAALRHHGRDHVLDRQEGPADVGFDDVAEVVRLDFPGRGLDRVA